MRSKEFAATIIQAVQAGEPVAAPCPYAGLCGGCAFQDRAYAHQVAAKTAALRRLWEADLAPPVLAALTTVPSPQPLAYRTRMDYVATKDRFGLRRRGKFNYIIELDQCHLLPPGGFQAALAVYRHTRALGLPDYNLRQNTGWLRYVFVRRSPDDQFLAGIVTASAEHAPAVADLAATALACAGVVSFYWLLNDTLTDRSLGTALQHWGLATLPMRTGQHVLQIGPNSFFQNNVYLLDALLATTAAATGPAAHVADLYGGVGTIALALAGQATRVVTVESVAESARLAAQNIAASGITNVRAVHADVLAYLRGCPPGMVDVVVADPPRTGLGPEVCAELLRLGPVRLVYVSCNPLTQREDARALAPGYDITRMTGFDMFPHTPHLESVAVFDRRA